MKGRRGRLALGAVLAAALAAAPAAPAEELDLDLRLGAWGGETFVGFGLLTGLGARGWAFHPNLEWVFVERGDLVALNADVHYDLRPSASVDAWLGGGVALLIDERPRGDTEAGINLLAGVGLLPGSTVRPFIEGKLVLADDSEGVLAFGVRF